MTDVEIDFSRKYDLAKIMFAIWDKENGTYKSGLSDLYVAQTYGFTLLEIEEIKKDFFESATERAKEARQEENRFRETKRVLSRIHNLSAKYERFLISYKEDIEKVCSFLEDVRKDVNILGERRFDVDPGWGLCLPDLAAIAEACAPIKDIIEKTGAYSAWLEVAAEVVHVSGWEYIEPKFDPDLERLERLILDEISEVADEKDEDTSV